jgi:glycosyl transferase family 7 (putative galactosyltransferase)
LVFDASFFRGHFQTTIPNGEVLFSKDHWKALGGYNEWLSGYGFDDTDFYIRLRSFGVKERHIPPSFLRTLKHAQAQRGGYKNTYRFMHIEDPSTKAAVDQYKNTLLSFMHEWNASLRTPYTVLANADHGVTVRTERLRDNYKFQDAIAETISALCIMTRDDATKRHIEGLIAWLVKEAGGFGEKPEW